MEQEHKIIREFLFVRHGQTAWNLQGRLQGRSNQPLDATGIAQAQAAADCLADEPVSAIVSSPLLRAHQTATIISKSLGVPVSIENDLIERNFGAFEGRLVSEIAPAGCTGLELASMENLAADTEPWASVCERVSVGVDKWLNDVSGQRLLFVSHFGVISALCQKLSVAKKPIKNAVPYRFVLKEKWSMAAVKAKV
jgi:broad specificity phosphatase PhoE